MVKLYSTLPRLLDLLSFGEQGKSNTMSLKAQNTQS